MYTERKIHTGFVGTLFVIAAVLLFLFHTRPAQKELNGLKMQAQVLSQELAGLQEKRSQLTAQGTLTEVEQKELDRKIPLALEQDQIVLDIEKMSKSADVSFNALTFNLDQNTLLPTVTISASFQGTSTNIMRFLKALEVNPRKFVIRDAGVTRTESVEGLDIVNLNVTFQSFFRPSPSRG
ncbi:MAG: hypothetical protein AAB588_03340 [Patescibacteria group bacterium]